MTLQNLLSEKEAAKILSFSVQTLRNDRATGRRIPYVKFHKSVRYRPEDLAAYIAAHRIGGQEGQAGGDYVEGTGTVPTGQSAPGIQLPPGTVPKNLPKHWPQDHVLR